MGKYPALHPGLADFALIRAEGGLYVDKTPCFRDLLETVPMRVSSVTPRLQATHQFLARPRRFGKSLLVSTLETWFQGLTPGWENQQAIDSPSLDGMPEGWTNPAWLWEGLDGADWHGTHGWHPVLRLDMSRLAPMTPDDLYTTLQRYMVQQTTRWARRNPGVADACAHIRQDDTPPDMLFGLMDGLGNVYGRAPVVLVDEYDAPITRYMGTDADLAPAMQALRDFYRVLKDDEGILYGVFVTGITRMVRPHLFSAANNFTDISDWDDYAGICGFTDDEVVECLSPYREALADLEPRLDEARMLTGWRDMYNGYRFSSMSTERVYNPYTLIHGLDRTLRHQRFRDAALQGRWPSAWSETATPALAVRMASDTRQQMPSGVRAGGLPSVPADSLDSLQQPNFVRIMQDTGYYTWYGGDDGNPLYLNFPNREVADSWLRDLVGLWDELEQPQAATQLKQIQKRLHEGDMDGFAQDLEVFFSGLAYQNLDSESCFRAVLQTLFRLAGNHVQAEKSAWGERSDLEVSVGAHTYVMEVKYGRGADEALRQIRDRPYGREHLHAEHNVIAVGLAFRKDGPQGARLEYRQANLSTLLNKRDADTPRRLSESH